MFSQPSPYLNNNLILQVIRWVVDVIVGKLQPERFGWMYHKLCIDRWV